MRGLPISKAALVFCILTRLWSDAACLAQSPANPEPGPKAGLVVWDTVRPAANALMPAALAGKNDWTLVPANRTAAFKGDAVVRNDRIAIALRQRDSAGDIYTLEGDGAIHRLRLRLLAGNDDPAQSLERVTLVENIKGAAALEATYQTAKGQKILARFRLKRGDIAVRTEPGSGADKLRVECPSRFVVLPDFFADDIMIDAARLPLPFVEIPSENFLLHPTGKNDAVAMCVFENRQQDVKLALAGEGAKRLILGSEIGFGGKKIWVAPMAAPNIWHAIDLTPAGSGKIIPLDWKMPFLAQWRVDFSRPNDLVDSWGMLLQHKKGAEYIKPAWFGGPAEKVNDATRRRFTEVLGFFPYPAWSDPSRRGYLQPLDLTTRTKFVSVLKYQGPVLVYPFNRLAETPPDIFTMVDVARNTLGVGPCQHILDLEGQKQEYKGVATCNVQDALLKIYEKGEQRMCRADVEKNLKDALTFVTHIRARINHYVEFGHKMRLYLEAQEKARPELREQLAELVKLTEELDARYAEREDRIQSVAKVAKMNDDFRKNVLDYEGADALERCKKYTAALVRIGGNQDKLVAECRWVVRTLRQRAGLLVAFDPRLAAVAAEIRARTQEALRNPANHEKARF